MLEEELASLQHEIWAHWMRYLYRCSSLDSHGNLVIPKEKKERWARQMDTKYCDLSEEEKESDREQAWKVMNALYKPKTAPEP